MKRCDVVLVRFPHPSGPRKKRPAVVVQSDAYLGTVNTVDVAEVTKNLTMASDRLFVHRLEHSRGQSHRPDPRFRRLLALARYGGCGHRGKRPGHAVAEP